MVAVSPEWPTVASAPQEWTVSAKVVQLLVATLERMGASRERFLQAANLDGRWLDSPDWRLTRNEVAALCELAIDQSGDPAFGLRWAEWTTTSSFNLLPQLLAHASTLRHAFEMLFRYKALVSDEIPIELFERGEEVELRGWFAQGESLRLRRLGAEMAFFGMFRMLRDYGPSANIKRVSFDYPAPDYRAEYTRMFEGLEQFEQPFSGIVFDRALMDAPSPHKDDVLESSLRTLAEQRVPQARDRAPYAARIRNVLLEQSAPHRVRVDTVARELEISARSLHRRLSEEGRSYSAIAREASVMVAKRLLTDERRTIQETAFAMGFSDATSFHRAFKRWTGATPTTFRPRR